MNHAGVSNLVQIVFDAVDLDNMDAYDPATGLFEAPFDGYFQFGAGAILSAASGTFGRRIRVYPEDGTLDQFLVEMMRINAGTQLMVQGTRGVYLNEGQKVFIGYVVGGGTADIYGSSTDPGASAYVDIVGYEL